MKLSFRPAASVAALVLALAMFGAAGSAGAATTAALPDVSTSTGITVRLTNFAGERLQVANVAVYVSNATESVGATTDSTGSVTVEHLDSTQTVTVENGRMPENGADTYTSVVETGVALVPGHTKVYALKVPLGATVSGRLVGPTATSGAHKTVTLSGRDLGPVSGIRSTVTDASGDYRLDGLPSGVWSVHASPRTSGQGLAWKTVTRQQTSAAPATRVTFSDHYLHSEYDLVILLTASKERYLEEISGATVTVTNEATGATRTQKTSEIVDDHQQASFDLSTGSYTVRLVTEARPGAPSQTLWLSRADLNAFVPDASAAVSVPVTYGGDAEYIGVFPAPTDG
jgi:hypothetical protein